MFSFRKRIKSLTDSFAEDLLGGVHWGLYLPSKEAEWKDYLVLTPGTTDEPSRDSGNTTIETRRILFKLYTNTFEAATRVVDNLYKFFYKLEETLEDGNRIIDGMKESEDTFLDPDRWEDGSEIWTSVLLMAFTVQREVGV